MGFINDLRRANEKNQERLATQNSFGDWIPEIGLADDEIAWVHLLSKGDGSDQRFGTARVHPELKVSSKGNRYNVFHYCSMEDTGTCRYCDEEWDGRYHLAIWCYVYEIWHKSQSKDQGTQWPVTTTKGGKTYYVEAVDNVMLFRRGHGQKGYILDFFITAFDRFGTLDDHLFEISRKGSGMEDTSYQIMSSGDTLPLQTLLNDPKNAGLQAFVEALPSIEMVFKNRVKYDGEANSYTLLPEPEQTVVKRQEPVPEAAAPAVPAAGGSRFGAPAAAAPVATPEPEPTPAPAPEAAASRFGTAEPVAVQQEAEAVAAAADSPLKRLQARANGSAVAAAGVAPAASGGGELEELL